MEEVRKHLDLETLRAEVDGLTGEALIDCWIDFNHEKDGDPSVDASKLDLLEAALVREFGVNWREAVSAYEATREANPDRGKL